MSESHGPLKKESASSLRDQVARRPCKAHENSPPSVCYSCGESDNAVFETGKQRRIQYNQIKVVQENYLFRPTVDNVGRGGRRVTENERGVGGFRTV